jgi:hypothetical protein
MKLSTLGSRVSAALLFASASSAFATQGTSVEPSQVGSTGLATTTPHVPAAAGTPCVVNLFQNVVVMEQNQNTPLQGTPYTYAPPAGCRGPWAKVILKVTVDEEEGGYFSDATKAYVRLGGIPIFEGSLSNLPTQMPTLPPNADWTAERDVTDLASLFVWAHTGQVGLLPEQAIWQDNMTVEQASLSAQLLFYPASAATPAQSTADAVYRVVPEDDSVTLPHNIVRAYLDIYNAQPWWFTCIPTQEDKSGLPFFSPLAPGGADKAGIGPPGQGCDGGSFAEIGVSIDGTPAGVAPVAPLLSSNLNYFASLTFNAPIQPPQLLNYMPYRVDLTPFAAILNEAGAHTIALSRPANAYLLVYQDAGSTHVSGAVTLNTLAGSPGSPMVTDTIQTSGDTAAGTVTTGLDRNFTIQGFVNTSRGRVDSSVQQTSHFQNTQTFYLKGLDGLKIPESRRYQQNLSLTSTTSQHSHRTRAGLVLNDEVRTASYPLDLDYAMDGYTVDNGDGVETLPSDWSASVEQHRDLDAAYQKGGFGFYTSQVRDGFVSSRSRDLTTDQDSNWQAQAEYRFGDNQGSCYQSALTALDGAVASEVTGSGCSGGHNHVRWFAHPDGSPDSLGWAH